MIDLNLPDVCIHVQTQLNNTQRGEFPNCENVTLDYTERIQAQLWVIYRLRYRDFVIASVIGGMKLNKLSRFRVIILEPGDRVGKTKL